MIALRGMQAESTIRRASRWACFASTIFFADKGAMTRTLPSNFGLVDLATIEMVALALPSSSSGSTAELATFEFQMDEPQRHGRSRKNLLTTASTCHTTLPFASISTQTSPTLAFIIASAAEAPAEAPSTAPRWRIAAANLAAGATAGCAVEAALYPIDTIKTRLQAMRSGGGIRALIQAGGGRALYAGVWGNLVGVAPASAVFLAVYEPVKHAVIRAVGDDRAFLGPLAAGVAAGLASSVVRVPTEVVKTRMQTGEFKHAFTALRTIVAREGARGIFAGYGSFLLRDLPFDAIEFVAYEQFKKG
jgi:hypothetical protein